MIFDEQQQAVRLVPVLLVFEPDVGTGNGLNASLARRLVKLDQPEQVAKVCQGQCGLLVLRRPAHQIRDARDTINDRKFGVNAEMNEGRGGVRVCHY